MMDVSWFISISLDKTTKEGNKVELIGSFLKMFKRNGALLKKVK